MLLYKYFPDIDRFCVFNKGYSPSLTNAKSSQYFKGIEYFRYIPLGEISLSAVNRDLSVRPQEICCEITTRCNLFCKVCIADSSALNVRDLPLSRYEEVISAQASRIKRITLTGGEPASRVELFKFVRQAMLLGIDIVISTNGQEINKLRAAVSDFCPITIAVSVHGLGAFHDDFVGRAGAFRKAITAIKSLISDGHRVQVFTTCIQSPLSQLKELASYIDQFHIREHRLCLVKRRGRNITKGLVWNEVLSAIEGSQLSRKLSIKRTSQPFRFLSSSGRLEVRYGA